MMQQNINPTSAQNGTIPPKAPPFPPQPPLTNPPFMTVQPPKPKRKFNGTESIFAWISLFFGYLFCRAIPASAHPLGGLLFFLALFAITTIVLKRKGASFGKKAILSLLSALLVLPVLFLSANGLMQSFAFCYAIAAYAYYVYAAFGNTLSKKHSELILADYLKALFLMPFASFGEVFPALTGAKDKRWNRSLLRILCGLAVTLIPTGIVIALLSYDADFVKLLRMIFDFRPEDIFLHLFSALCGLPVGMYVFGLFLSSADQKCADIVTAESCRKTVGRMRILPAATALAAVVPILAVYVLFFISQWKYYLSGFIGILPEEFSYATYAREGFFQLLAVSIINFVLIAAVSLFLKRPKGKSSLLLKILSVVIAVFTLALISTAMAKLILYIDAFGLTPKRVYAAWFMLVLVVLFVLICLKQFVRKCKLIPTALTAVVILFAALGLSGTDSWIAKYNVDRYLSGSLEEIDISAMEDLGDAAIPQLVRLAVEMDEGSMTSVAEDVLASSYSSSQDAYTKTVAALADAAERHEDSIFSLTLPGILKQAALSSIDLPLGDAFTQARGDRIESEIVEWSESELY